MPLKLNIGLSKKVGEASYGSRGASINVEVEVESSLVDDPTKFRERVRQVFSLARNSLAEELNGHGTPDAANVHADAKQNGTSSNGSPPRPATQSQVKALFAITKSQNMNLSQLLRDRFQRSHAEELSVKEASQLIDELKRKE